MNWFRKFKWESRDQELGYKSFVQWARRRRLPEDVRPMDLYLIQKDHESDEYWVELVGTQFTRLENEIRILQGEVASLKKNFGVKK